MLTIVVDGGVECADLIQAEIMRRFSVRTVERVHRAIEIRVDVSEDAMLAVAEMALAFAGVESVYEDGCPSRPA